MNCSHPSKRSKYIDTGGQFIFTGTFARGTTQFSNLTLS